MTTTELSAEGKKLVAHQGTLRIGDVAPDATVHTQLGDMSLYDYWGAGWGILFSHPRDFTPVCTTGLGRVAQLKDEWAQRNIKVIALSVDTVDHHEEWIKDINDIGNTVVDYPIIADPDRSISLLYGMLDQSHLNATGMPFTVRSVYVIGPDRKVKLIITYPASTGRDFGEILRVIDSLQLAVSHKLATPADWHKGDTCVVLPDVPTEDARKLFPKGVDVKRPWLRTTPDPTA